MKTFNESDLITWANRDKAEVGKEYYFADSLNDLRIKVKDTIPVTLIRIDKDNCAYTFENEHLTYYACILSVDAVKEEKTYRACRTIEEFSDVVDLSSINYDDDSYYIYDLIDKTIHIRSKNTGTEYYTSIRSISVDENGYIKILMTGKSYLSFNDIFNNYEIEKNGEWLPFGVLEK